MTDDTPSPDTAPAPPPADLESRLRAALTHKGEGAPVGAADWGDLAGRLASSSRRRSRVLAGAAVVALLVGAAGGYFGEAAASPSLTASRPAPSGSKTSDTGASGTARAPVPSGSGPSSAVMCPDRTTNPSASDIGSATRLFVRTTSDGVTVRAYRLASSGFSCGVAPTPITVPGIAEPDVTGPNTTGPSTAGPSTAGPNTAGSGASGSSPGSAGSGGTTGSTVLPPVIDSVSQVTVELSDDNAVGQGVLSGSVCVGSPVPAGAGATSTTPTTAPAAAPQDITTGTFGVLEGDPVWWVAVDVSSDVTAVQMTFPDGSTDQMAPVDGIVVVARRIPASLASADPGPYTVRGTLTLLGAGGTVLDTVTLPQSAPVPVPAPGPEPTPVPLNGVAGSSSSAMVVCPQVTTTPPKTQSSATTENR